MDFEPMLAMISLVIGAVVSLGVALYAWQRRSIPGAEYFTLYMLAAVQWSLAQMAVFISSDPSAMRLWELFGTIGVTIMPIAWLAFAQKYTGRGKWLTKGKWMLILALPALSLLMWQSFVIYAVIQLIRGAVIQNPIPSMGIFIQISNIYISLFLFAGTLLIIQELTQAPQRYRSQYYYLLIGMWGPWVFGVPALWGFPFPLQLLPFGFAIGGILAAWGIFQHQVFEIMPIALDTVIQSISDGVIVLDTQHRIVDLNPAAQSMTNLSAEQALGKPISQVLEKWEALLDCLEQGREEAGITIRGPSQRHSADDGNYYELHISPLFGRQENLSGQLILLHDVTDRRQSEMRLQEAKAVAEAARMAAEAANRAKSDFLANMSHELRTPLNAILGFAQLMTHDPGLTAEQKENLGIIGRSGEHLLALINDVLELSKIEASRMTLQEESFDLHHLLGGLEEMFHLRAAEKDLLLIVDRQPNVPQYVRTDKGKLRQVLMNLLGNAVKYTEEGGVTLRAGVKERDNGHNASLIFEVEDSGPGIAAEETDAVFDPFRQTATGRSSEEGTGLGLAISRQFVRLMGGGLTFSTTLGEGSVFKFEMPIELAESTDVPAVQPARRAIGLESGQTAYRLLVVEDREPSRKLLVKLLKPIGFEVREAVNGKEAIEIWEQWEPHLIWMDMRMPVMDGYETTKRIKATTRGHATVIVALTASAFEEDRKMILSEGCDDFVRKPFRETEIFDKLTEHLGVRFVYEETAPSPTASSPGRASDMTAAPEEQLTTDALAALPDHLLVELTRASLRADSHLILELIEQIRTLNPPVADALAAQVRNYRFDIIVNLTQEIGG